MKIKKRFQKIDITMAVIMQVCAFIPWISHGTGRYTAHAYLLWCLQSGDFAKVYRSVFLNNNYVIDDAIRTVGTCFVAVCVLAVLLQLFAVIYGIASLAGRKWTKKPLVGIMCLMIPALMLMEAESYSGTTITGESGAALIPARIFMFMLITAVLSGFWFLIEKASEEWDDAAARERDERSKKKEYKKERKRRLYFPGKYSRLFYQVLLKDLRFRFRDVSYLFLSAVMSAFLLLIGTGMRDMFRNSYGEDESLLGLGLSNIMQDFLVVIVIVSLFLLTTIMVYYRKKRMANNGLLQLLGMRSDMSFVVWLGELLLCMISGLLVGLALGALFLQLFRLGLYQLYPDLGRLGNATIFAYLNAAWEMLAICGLAYGFSHDIYGRQESADSRGAAVQSEKLPGSHAWIGIAVGLIGMVYSVDRYMQRRTAEKLWVLALFFVCLYVLIYNVWGVQLKRKRKHVKAYLKDLPFIHMIQYRFKTATQYISLFAILHICVLFYFSFVVVSNLSATKVEQLYPYDYVLLANSQDQDTLEQLEKKCQGDVTTFPMVRATTKDNTERLESYTSIVLQQGQNIGISESTYRALKELQGEKPKENLGLDDKGRKIYVAYQQDQGTKARPLDWWQWTKEPFIHIGQPMYGYNVYEYRKYYPHRHIVGSEMGSLIGAFKQGKYENLIVFSDAYFDKMKDSWKTTDMNTGEKLSEEEAIPEETIHEGPDRLVLVNVPESKRAQAEQLIENFQKKHAYDESFDPLVKSAYRKSEAVKQRKLERLFMISIAGSLWVMLAVIGAMLLNIKIKMELPEMKKRYTFMEQFGMREQERIAAEKQEISRYVRLPLLIGIPVAMGFTVLLFWLRNFTGKDMIVYMKYMVPVGLLYVGIQLVNLKLLQRQAVRKVEHHE